MEYYFVLKYILHLCKFIEVNSRLLQFIESWIPYIYVYFFIFAFFHLTNPKVNLCLHNYLMAFSRRMQIAFWGKMLLFICSVLSKLLEIVFDKFTIWVAYQEWWDSYWTTFSIVGHNYLMWSLIFLVVDNHSKDATKFLNMLCFEHKVAFSSIYHNYWAMTCILGLFKIIFFKMFILKWQTTILILFWIVHSADQ